MPHMPHSVLYAQIACHNHFSMHAVSSQPLVVSSEPVSLAFALYLKGDRTSLTAAIVPDGAQKYGATGNKCSCFFTE